MKVIDDIIGAIDCIVGILGGVILLYICYNIKEQMEQKENFDL